MEKTRRNKAVLYGNNVVRLRTKTGGKLGLVFSGKIEYNNTDSHLKDKTF
jgi:hypothetical protein